MEQISFSKMRVDLATQESISLYGCVGVQVMSDSVFKALLLTSGSGAFETSLFIGKGDKFCDRLNVTSYRKSIKTKKPFQKL